MSHDIEADLIAKARNGDPSAAPFLISYLGEHLLGFAHAHAPDLGDADRESVVELAVEAGVRAIARFDPTKGTLRRWLRRQVVWQVAGWRRQHDSPAELPPGWTRDPSTEPEEDPAVTEAMRSALAKLNFDDNVTLALRAGDGLAFSEIAQRLSITEDNARQRYHRAKSKLKSYAAAEPALAKYLEEEAT